MKIFSSAPEGNEMAELANARYFNLAIRQLEEHIEWLKTSNKPVQAVLAHIDILLLLSRKFRADANLSIEKDRVQEWEKTFYEWFDRCGGKIPAKYRDGIKQSADELFQELNTFGH